MWGYFASILSKSESAGSEIESETTESEIESEPEGGKDVKVRSRKTRSRNQKLEVDDLSFEEDLSDGDNISDLEDVSKMISKILDTGNCESLQS